MIEIRSHYQVSRGERNFKREAKRETHREIRQEALENAELERKPISYFPPTALAVEKYRSEKGFTSGEFMPLAENHRKLKYLLKHHGNVQDPRLEPTVYNPSLVFNHHGDEFIMGRTEGSRKEQEHGSVTVAFKHVGEHWIPQLEKRFKIQDPNICWIYGTMVLSGVELYENAKTGNMDYRMAFYMGNDIDSLELVCKSPLYNKNVRLCMMARGNGEKKVGIYTRPQGEKGGAGQIGFTVVNSLEEFIENSEKIIEDAPLLDMRFPDGEWGGINQIINLKDGRNLLVGHRAYRDKDDIRHYFPWACIHNPYTAEIIDLGILAERSDFGPSSAKAPDLVDVLYTVGVTRKKVDGVWQWFLIVGVSDAHTGIIKLQQRALFPENAPLKLAA